MKSKNKDFTVKMVVTDLDGTLFKTNKSISNYTIETIEQVCERGIKVSGLDIKTLATFLLPRNEVA